MISPKVSLQRGFQYKSRGQGEEVAPLRLSKDECHARPWSSPHAHVHDRHGVTRCVQIAASLQHGVGAGYAGVWQGGGEETGERQGRVGRMGRIACGDAC